MKRQLLVTVEYPNDTTANMFMDIAIKSVLNDINADCEEGWSVTYTDINNEGETTMETTTFNNYTEEQALQLVATFITRFGWKTAIFHDEDIKDAWKSRTDEDITDSQLAQVKGTRDWIKYFDEILVREGLEFLDTICYDIINENKGE